MDADTLFQQLQSLPAAQRQQFFARLRARSDYWKELHSQPQQSSGNGFHYQLVFDGGSLGNPGKGYGSYALTRCDTGQQRLERLDFPGQMTNNEAEYLTLVRALEALVEKISSCGKDPKRFRIEIRGDSKLVVNQVNRVWKTRQPRMKELCEQAQALLAQLGGYRLIHHGREHSVEILGH